MGIGAPEDRCLKASDLASTRRESFVFSFKCSKFFVYLRFGKEQFPFLLRDMESDIEVIDGTLTKEAVSGLSETVGRNLSSHQYSGAVANHAALFIEEICLTIQTGSWRLIVMKKHIL